MENKTFTYFENHGNEDGTDSFTICFGDPDDADFIITGAEDTEEAAKESVKRLNEILSQQCLEKQKELQLKSVAVLNLLRQNESQQAEIDRLKEECDQFAMKFLEYASGLAISNYASGGTWYLNDGSFVSTYKILEQFKSLER